MKNFKSVSENHNYNFKDPETGAHNNKIEGLWSQFKRKFKAMNGCKRAHLQSYLNEFMWRQWHDVNRVEAFDKLLEEIGKYYPADDLKLVDFKEEVEENKISFSEWTEKDEKDGTWSNSRLEESDEEENERVESDEEENERVESDEEENERVEIDEEENERVESESDEDLENMTISQIDSNEIVTFKLNKIFKFLESHIYCFEFKKLNKHQRKLIHQTVQENCVDLFHFTRQGTLYVSNDDKDENLFKKYCKLKGLDKQVNEKLESINDKLNNLSLSAVKQNQLILQKSAYITGIDISDDTTKSVENVLEKNEKNVLCKLCLKNGVEKLCNGEVGLRVHTGRMHKK